MLNEFNFKLTRLPVTVPVTPGGVASFDFNAVAVAADNPAGSAEVDKAAEIVVETAHWEKREKGANLPYIHTNINDYNSNGGTVHSDDTEQGVALWIYDFEYAPDFSFISGQVVVHDL